MKLTDREKQLVIDNPLMKCGNRSEFNQRLQWLSEGMLKNHLEPVDDWKVSQDEIGQYKQFRGRIGYLKKDRKERFNLKRGWYVNAWRVVDANGNDIIQPWMDTKGEARATAKACGIHIAGDMK